MAPQTRGHGAQSNESLRRVAEDLAGAHSRLINSIMATPTGERRNTLADAQIHLGEAVNALERALTKEIQK